MPAGLKQSFLGMGLATRGGLIGSSDVLKHTHHVLTVIEYNEDANRVGQMADLYSRNNTAQALNPCARTFVRTYMELKVNFHFQFYMYNPGVRKYAHATSQPV